MAATDLDFDWTTAGALGEDYFARLMKIQDQDPVFWSRAQNAWIVTRYQDIIEGMKDRRLSNRRYHLGLEQRAQEDEALNGATLATVKRWLFNQDAPEHMRLRVLLMKPFQKSQADSYRMMVREILDRRLSELEGRPSFDFYTEFAALFVAEVLLRVIGFSGVIAPEKLIGMATAISLALSNLSSIEAVRAADEAIEELTPLILNEIDKRRKKPQPDLLTNLVEVSEGGDRLSEEDLISLFHVLLLAAIDTTAKTLTLIVPVLDASAERRDYIRQNPDKITQIVEELQRYVGMMNMMHRIAAEDFEWHGKQIRRGDMVFFMLGVGNWDKRVFNEPQVLNFERERKQQLTFAPGLHHCIGIHIAKMELEEALLGIFRRFDRVQVLNEPQYQSDYMTRSFVTLQTRLRGTRHVP